ncbi:hypothetical protein ACWGPD_37540 [Streptomyces hirsutus]|uniref:hypothetical protein n=1 Tax=Streptomyces hirsutus TaxID=35620 RepID=UPI00332ACA42
MSTFPVFGGRHGVTGADRGNRPRWVHDRIAGPGSPPWSRSQTWSGWVYVALVLDAYSRRIVGRQAAIHMRTDLPLDALETALWRQKIKKDAGLVHPGRAGRFPVGRGVQR